MRDVLVIGGGIIGLMTARELMLAGAKVTLIEMGQTGRESSWAGGGIISPLYPWRSPAPVTALALWSQNAYPALASELLDETGIDPELSTNGLLILDTEETERALAWSGHHGQDVEVLQASQLGEIEPELAAHPEGSLFFPRIAQVRPPRLSKAIRRALEKRVDLHEREEVVELLVEADQVRGVRTPKGRIEAERIVVCAGAWTAKLLEQLGTPPDIHPVRGQMLLFHAKPGQIRHITLHAERYAIPRLDGRVLFGSTLEHAGFAKTTTAEEKEALYQDAVAMFPLLKRTPIEDHWAGLRPGSPSGIPYIGAYPGIEGLYFNAGHFRNGLVMGPASARLIADLMLGDSPILDPAHYALDAPR